MFSRCGSKGSINTLSSSAHNTDDEDSDGKSRMSYKKRKRDDHTQAEQKRRDAIEAGYDSLQKLVPMCQQNESRIGYELSKSTILQKSIDYIQYLLQNKKKQEKELAALRKELLALRIMKVEYEQIVKAHQNQPGIGDLQILDEDKCQVESDMIKTDVKKVKRKKRKVSKKKEEAGPVEKPKEINRMEDFPVSDSLVSDDITPFDESIEETNTLLPLKDFINDRTKLISEAMDALKGKRLDAMMPSHLKNYSRSEFQSCCLKVLNRFSNETIIAVLEGRSGITAIENKKEMPEKTEKPKELLSVEKLKTLLKNDTGLKASSSVVQKDKKIEKKVPEKAKSSDSESSKNAKKQSKKRKKSKLTKIQKRQLKKMKKNLEGEDPDAANLLPGGQRTIMELLELEFRAKAIKALLKNQGIQGNIDEIINQDETKEKRPNSNDGLKSPEVLTTTVVSTENKELSERTMNKKPGPTPSQMKASDGGGNGLAFQNPDQLMESPVELKIVRESQDHPMGIDDDELEKDEEGLNSPGASPSNIHVDEYDEVILDIGCGIGSEFRRELYPERSAEGMEKPKRNFRKLSTASSQESESAVEEGEIFILNKRFNHDSSDESRDSSKKSFQNDSDHESISKAAPVSPRRPLTLVELVESQVRPIRGDSQEEMRIENQASNEGIMEEECDDVLDLGLMSSTNLDGSGYESLMPPTVTPGAQTVKFVGEVEGEVNPRVCKSPTHEDIVSGEELDFGENESEEEKEAEPEESPKELHKTEEEGEEEAQDGENPETWYERWYFSKKVQNVAKSTKMMGKLRKVKESGKKSSEAKSEPDGPKLDIVGSMAEYASLFGKAEGDGEEVKEVEEAQEPPLIEKKTEVEILPPPPILREDEEDEENDELWGNIIGS